MLWIDKILLKAGSRDGNAGIMITIILLVVLLFYLFTSMPSAIWNEQTHINILDAPVTDKDRKNITSSEKFLSGIKNTENVLIEVAAKVIAESKKKAIAGIKKKAVSKGADVFATMEATVDNTLAAVPQGAKTVVLATSNIPTNSMTTSTTKTSTGETEMELPPAQYVNNPVFSYMPRMVQSNYSISLWKEYNGYILANGTMPGKIMTRDANNLCRVGTDYVVAMGTFYTGRVSDTVANTRFRITMQNGSVTSAFTVLIGDVKSDGDTDAKHQYHKKDGSIIEFHTWDRKYVQGTTLKKLFPGKIVGITKIAGPPTGTVGGVAGGTTVSTAATGDGQMAISRREMQYLISGFSVQMLQLLPAFAKLSEGDNGYESIKNADSESQGFWGSIKGFFQSIWNGGRKIVSIATNIFKGAKTVVTYVWQEINKKNDLKRYTEKLEKLMSGFFRVTYDVNGATGDIVFEKTVVTTKTVTTVVPGVTLVGKTSAATALPAPPTLKTETVTETQIIRYLKPRIDWKGFKTAELSEIMSKQEMEYFHDAYGKSAIVNDVADKITEEHFQMIWEGIDEIILIDAPGVFINGTAKTGGDYGTYTGDATPGKGGKLGYPLPANYNYNSSSYGWRIHPITHVRKFHAGVDIPTGGKIGVPLFAAEAGTVTFAGWQNPSNRTEGYGLYVIISHGKYGGSSDIMTTRYGHTSSLLVKTGDNVIKGQTIALSGSTGASTGPHLHFEVRFNGQPTNPVPWVTK